MDQDRNCGICQKALDDQDGILIHGFGWYCDPCYERELHASPFAETEITMDPNLARNIGKRFEEYDLDEEVAIHIQQYRKTHKSITPINTVSEAKNVSVVGQIVAYQGQKFVIANQTEVRKVEYIVKDDTGEILLVLWNVPPEKVELYGIYHIQGYITSFKGMEQMTLGYQGKMELLPL